MSWLDPRREQPTTHSASECLLLLEPPDPLDVGRRWECDTCGRTYLAADRGHGPTWLTLTTHPPETP